MAGCGSEQFGTTPQSTSSTSNPLQVYQQSSCSGHTLVKPIVDILYVVDNSLSNYWIANDVKAGIQDTIASLSSQFDYRIIGTPLLQTPDGNADYQVLAKDPTSLPVAIPSYKRITAASQFTFFSTPVSGLETGTRRTREFISAHSSDGLFRQGAYLFVVLVSNGRDTEIENPPVFTGGPTSQNTANFNARKQEFAVLKSSLQSQQFRLFSLTANTKCTPTRTGYTASPFSYSAMSKALYDAHAGFPNIGLTPDHYDLCSQTNVSSVFTDVNNSIQQIIVPHTYKYWPITSTDGTIDTQPGKIKVYKSSPNSAPVELTSGWSYLPNPGSTNTRILPTPGEPTTRAHLIEFSSGNYVTYPDCISISTSSNLEYFGFVAIPKTPTLSSVVIKINGAQVPAGGWSYMSAEGFQNINIKVAHNGYPNTPPVMRQGYMLKLTSNYYYKSGDNVEVYYVPAP